MITGKYAVRKPNADEMQLLPYVLDPFNKAQRLLGMEPLADFAPHASFDLKLLILRQLADGMERLMPQVAALGHDVPVGVETAVKKYLDLLDGALV